MTAMELVTRWRAARYRLFRWRCELGRARKVGLCLALAGLTGLCAQVRFVLPFTPVPITGQVFAVLLAGVLLGGRYGALSQVIYVALGSAGVPWFAGGAAGLPLGPSGGYLLGFIPAAWLVGYLTDRRIAFRRIWAQALLMMAAVGVIYFFGAVQFAVVMHAGLRATLVGAVLPFVAVDLAKAAAAAAVSSALLPKAAYNGEVDKAEWSRGT